MIRRIPRAADMRALGAALGRALITADDRPQVVALNGELGAGKTTFVGGVLEGMGIPGPARSPTYALIEPYEAGGRYIYHLDLYRLAGAADLEGLGLRDLLEPRSTLLVEWAERAGATLPAADLVLTFQYAAGSAVSQDDSAREVHIESLTPSGAVLAAALSGPAER